MSVTMSRADGVTVFTLTSDPDSRWPPLCQILKSLCYSPACCGVSQSLRNVLGTSQSVLGAIHIMIGLLQIGLSIILLLTHSGPRMYDLINVLFGIVSLFIVFGIICILSEKYPSPCLVIINVIVNLAGVALAITAIVLCSLIMGDIYPWFGCDRRDDYYWSYRSTTPSPAIDTQYIKERCLEAKALAATPEDPELYKPLLEEVATEPAA
uniref:Transmembrane protein 176B-like n=1 Tax=Fundulus heteroclitus TaxID=8078 RepID=A0A3Q2Q8W7_FUNHE